jgi:hypothetical protein
MWDRKRLCQVVYLFLPTVAESQLLLEFTSLFVLANLLETDQFFQSTQKGFILFKKTTAYELWEKGGKCSRNYNSPKLDVLWLTLLLCCSFIKLVEDKLKKT